jgi:NitT/TauT family transport system substrate-binding protein
MRYIRITFLLAALSLLGVVAAQGAQQQQEGQEEVHTVNIGMQATGTFSWVIFAMQHYGFDKQYHLKLNVKKLASKSASKLALRAGAVDIVVDDFIGAQILHDSGVPVHVIYPYSKATGGVVVKEDSNIKSVADLKGKKIAASALNDKSLLILRALAIAKYNFDPQDASHILAAAPPLMESLLAKGDIDAAIPYWHFVARMVASGKYRELISDVDMLKQLNFNTNVALLVVVAREDLNHAAAGDFVKALVATTDKMKTDDAIWQDILNKGLYSLPDPSLFPAVRARWEEGLPTEWNQTDVNAMVKLVQQLVNVAGADVVGVKKIDPQVYDTEFAP